ncbi:MAG: DUF4349 domain-containing protein [Bacteroidales bacterium]|nr:DUF4349 domain-containing protein [Bacteroidales bacterium]MDD4575884.1 DUF4349 domain-containing protein [Bacteroidales bacterium]
MKTYKISFLLLLASAFIVFSCSSREATENIQNFDSEILEEMSFSKGTQENSYSSTQMEKDERSSMEASESVSQYIIKTADIKMMVEDVNLSTDNIEKILKVNDGFIDNSNLETKPYSLSNTLNIRVPAAQFDLVIKEITTLAEYIDHRVVKAEDATKAYVDTEVRLKNKLEVEKRYIEILRNQAKTVADVLEVERQLNDIRIEIESAQSYLNTLKDQIKYSTINLEIYQTVNYVKKPETNQKSFFTDVKEALQFGWNAVLSFILVFLHLWPLFAIASLIVITVVFIKRRKK